MISWMRSPIFLKYIYFHSRWTCWIEQNILFTFDDGPGPHTNYLLDLAQKYRIKFAFFVLPEQAQKYPKIISRIVSEGHILGSHFFKHRNHMLDTKTIFLKSLNDSIQEIESISKDTIQYCRVPYGHLFPWQDKWIRQSGYEHIFWSLSSKDYLIEAREKVISRIQKNIQVNDIVLLHDGESSHPHIVQIVDECLRSLDSIL